MYGVGNYLWKIKMKLNYDIGFLDGIEDEDYLVIFVEWLFYFIELYDLSLVFF